MNLIYLISALYLLSSLIYGTYLWSQKRKISRAGVYFAVAGVLVHTTLLVVFLMRGDILAGSTSRPLFIFSWLITLVFLVSQLRFKTPVLGAFVLPVAFLGTLPYVIIPDGMITQDPTLANPWILAHILSIFLGEAFFRDILSRGRNLHISGKSAQVEKNRNPPEKTSFPDNP